MFYTFFLYMYTRVYLLLINSELYVLVRQDHPFICLCEQSTKMLIYIFSFLKKYQ